ncbi:hypothetical protein D4Z93_02755 [Clostridium fermenticellae]|uniref:Uncharacterized protein n=1 Tax=Clostridium fermenticellae TaxID=2068654 RepID=A0A386H1C9_9CLOT|nr:hypothetical protein [Clostridium fermenticellae]AYD39517.1 hypothetical protein D4Z93_02755 [Clostridium fermenticellae]
MKKEISFYPPKAPKDSGNIKVKYNNGKSGKNPDVFCIKFSVILAQISNKMLLGYKKYEGNLRYINIVIGDLKNVLFLNPIL